MQYLKSFLDDPVLFAFLLVLLGYFVISLALFFNYTSKLRDYIEELSGRVNEDSEVPETNPLYRNWKQYRRTFINSGEKTAEGASTFFSEDAVVGNWINLRYWKAVASFLIGTGILGTFVGLTFGISAFETESVETVRTSIERLLAGIGTAFISSIAGMSLSIVFNMVEKARLGKLNQQVRTLCGNLDSQFLLTAADHRILQIKDERSLLKEIFAYKDDGDEILPAHVLRDMRKESREQTKTLKSFSSDLADGIMLSTMTIEKMGGKLGEAFQVAMKRQLTPTMESMQGAVDALRKEKAASNDEMVQNVVDRLSQTLQDISGQFQESLSGGAVAQLEQTAETIGETGELLADFQSSFKSMVADLQDSLKSMAQKTGEEAQHATIAMREQVEAAAGTVRAEMEGASADVGKEIKLLQDNSAELLKQHHTTAETVYLMLEQGGDIAGRLKQTVETFDETLVRLRETSSGLKDTAETTRQSSSTLRASSEQLKAYQEEWLQAETETLSELASALKETRELSQLYVKQFETVQSSLSDIFGEIQEGLNDYQNTTRKSINNYLSGLGDNLQTATNALNGTVAALTESFDELHEVVDRIGSQKNGQNRS